MFAAHLTFGPGAVWSVVVFPLAELASECAATAPLPVLPLLRQVQDTEPCLRWWFLHANAPRDYRPCFSLALLETVRAAQLQWREQLRHLPDSDAAVRYLVLASDNRAFGLGGDLAHFLALIRGRDRQALFHYARVCVEIAQGLHCLHEDRVFSVALVQGDALGGGFEAALACNAIIAEAGVTMGFPEVMFDLFPGMGAYTFLSRRVSRTVAERMMLDARTYTAEELHALGIVDVVAPAGQGLAAARAFIAARRRMDNAVRAMNAVRQIAAPVCFDELMHITSAWVDAALRLGDRGLRVMERLVHAQQRRARAEQAFAGGSSLS